MTENLEGLSKYERLLLKMEDVIEHRIKVDKKVCTGTSRDWKDLYDGKCESCGRPYEAEYLVNFDPNSNHYKQSSDRGDCIPCWREKNDLPKIDSNEREELIDW
jgi:hypothetical protein